jgi:hypothetical protein
MTLVFRLLVIAIITMAAVLLAVSYLNPTSIHRFF